MDNTQIKVVFIVNPASGTGQKTSLEKVIEKHLDLAKYRYEIKFVRGPGHAYLLAQEAIAEGARMVVVAGGDGSVSLVAKALTGTSIIMGIIPTGSGNGLARHLGIAVNPVIAVEILNRGSVMQMDTATLNNEFFVSIAGVRFDALVASTFATRSRRGFRSYFSIILSEYLHYKPRNYRIILDGHEINCRAFFISMANAGQFGYNTVIAPDARVDDGLLDVCIVDKPPLFSVPYVAFMFLTGRIGRLSLVKYYKAREIKVMQSESSPVNIDGDPVFLEKDLTVLVKPLSLRVVIP
jgi:diacylglycerol kinase (ATP)